MAIHPVQEELLYVAIDEGREVRPVLDKDGTAIGELAATLDERAIRFLRLERRFPETEDELAQTATAMAARRGKIGAVEPGESLLFAWVIDVGGQAAGLISAVGDAGGQQLELTVVISPGFRRGGLAKDALTAACRPMFESIEAGWLLAVVDQENAASIALVTSLGFSDEGPYPGGSNAYILCAPRRGG